MPGSILVCFVGSCFWAAIASGEARTLTVAADGSGELKSVQGAVDSIPAKNEEPVIIHVGAGRYKEKIYLPRGKRFVTIRGDDAAATVLTYDQNAASLGPGGKPLGASGSYSTWVDADDFLAENITFENAFREIGDHIKPAGWDNWRNAENEKTARYAEYKCTGPGAGRAGRVDWSLELTDQEGKKLTVANILGGEDKWGPSQGRSEP
jgi:pectin methylesterase-like acyl-CoA thioesterase